MGSYEVSTGRRNEQKRTHLYRIFRKKGREGILFRYYCQGTHPGDGVASCTGRISRLLFSLGGFSLISDYDLDQTVFPGQSRSILKSEDPDSEIARLVYMGEEGYELRLKAEDRTVCIRIRFWGRFCEFYHNDRLIAEFGSLLQPRQFADWEMSSFFIHYVPMKRELALLLMNVPMLRFTP